MIVVGVDPGARETGIAVVDTRRRLRLASTTIARPADRQAPILEVEPEYLAGVAAVVLDALSGDLVVAAELIAVESVRRPSWRVQGKVKPTDPSAIIATGLVLGAILGRAWSVPVVTVPPGRNGSQELGSYPAELVSAAERRGRGWEFRPAGDGKLRHERSAFDVALEGPFRLGMTRTSGSVYR